MAIENPIFVETNAVSQTTQCVNVALIGATGRIGRRVLDLLATRHAAAAAHGLQFRLVAVANSQCWLIDRQGLTVPHVAEQLIMAEPRPATEFVATLVQLAPHALNLHPLIVIDCTASAEIAQHYPQWLAGRVRCGHPRTSTARRPIDRSRTRLRLLGTGAIVRDATTVGAQLPLLATLRELHQAGDRVERFEAVLSGTLSYVLWHVQQGAALSNAVRDAITHGFAEPHPACDLSGEDAARKLVILLRALGHDVVLSDVERVALVDAQLLAEPDPALLLQRLGLADEIWRARAALAQVRRERWIYRASFENGHARVAPECVPLDHPFANLAPCENALLLHSTFYRAAPLRISGPGAGIDLTAAGVFGDLLAAAQRYAAPPNLWASSLPISAASESKWRKDFLSAATMIEAAA